MMKQKNKVIEHFNFATQTIENISRNGGKTYDNQINIVKGQYSMKNTQQITDDLEWRMNSIVKSMTTTLMDILGYDFDSPIEQYFPNLEVHEDFQGKTLRTFMNHMSGIVDLENYPKILPKIIPMLNDGKSAKTIRSEITNFILTNPLGNSKVKKFVYGNLNYVILGNIIETQNQENKTYEQISREEFKKKIPDFDFSFEFRNKNKNARISGHYGETAKIADQETKKAWQYFLELEKTNIEGIFLSKGGFPQFFNPAGGLVTTHNNLQKYGQWQAQNILKKKREGTFENYFLKDAFIGKVDDYTVGWVMEKLSNPKDKNKKIELSHEGTNEATYSSFKIEVQFEHLHDSYGKLKRSTSENYFQNEMKIQNRLSKDDLEIKKLTNFEKLYQQETEEEEDEEDDENYFNMLKIRSRLEEDNDLMYEKKRRQRRLSIRYFAEGEGEVFRENKPKQYISVKTHTGNYPMSPLSNEPFWDVLYEKIKEEEQSKERLMETISHEVEPLAIESDEQSTEDDDENVQLEKTILLL